MQAARVSNCTFTRCLKLHHPNHRITPIAAMLTSNSARKPKVLVVAGPTAVVKTAISLALAERLNDEIISADSVQVHKGLGIGSDKVRYSIRKIIDPAKPAFKKSRAGLPSYYTVIISYYSLLTCVF